MKQDEDKHTQTPSNKAHKDLAIPFRHPEMNRRKFVEMAASAAVAFTIIPRHVLGGKNYVAPSDKITLGYIGIGTQGIRELLPLLANEQFQVIAVCDPNKEAIGYKDWGKDYLKNDIRKAIKNPAWGCYKNDASDTTCQNCRKKVNG